MRFRLGFVIGFGAGYVLGTRAGRERYEQIRELFGQVSAAPVVQRAVEKTAGVAGEQGKRALSVVQEQVVKAGGAVKDRLGKNDPAADSAADSPTDPWRGSPVPDAAEGQLP
jgi:membrane carboxypeptidase/penicillin-binding protein PbpC